MIRTVLSICAIASLAACAGDGRGTAYSSARANPPAPTYIPVTPGAVPVGQPAQIVSHSAASLPRAPTTPTTPEPVARFATGPIYQACQSAGRKAASRARCGCVQWVADRELTPAQQRRGAGYFSNQHALQEVRQSSERVRANGEFWDAWKAYGDSAAAQCSGT